MAAFDYGTEAELSPAASKVGLLPTRSNRPRLKREGDQVVALPIRFHRILCTTASALCPLGRLFGRLLQRCSCRPGDRKMLQFLSTLECGCKPTRLQSAPRPRFGGVIRFRYLGATLPGRPALPRLKPRPSLRMHLKAGLTLRDARKEAKAILGAVAKAEQAKSNTAAGCAGATAGIGALPWSAPASKSMR
jgi:hypothetical protein